MASRPLAVRLSWLGALYLVQGLPVGFMATALPAHMRERGSSLTEIGLAGLVALPWALKLLWAPFVDRFGWRRIGRRKTWIIPLQIALAASFGIGALVDLDRIETLMIVLAATNLTAAILDVPVDGLAVDLLDPRELGPGNAAQVVGFKVGMLLGGGVLVWLFAGVGLPMLFAILASIVLASLAISLFMEEPPPTATAPTLQELARALALAVRQPGAPLLFAFIATYKLGESAADAMFKPFLVDHGYTTPRIALLVGTWGMGASIAGSLAGGVLARATGPVRAVAITGGLRIAAMIAQLGLTLVLPTSDRVLWVTVAEHFAGGSLTTAMFTLMMSRVDRRIGATHFTVLATIEVLGKAPGGWLSGALTERIGYSWTFGIAAALSAAFLLLAIPVSRAERRSADAN